MLSSSFTSLGLPPALWVFYGWGALVVLHFVRGFAICRLQIGPLAPVRATGSQLPGERDAEAKFREQYRERFNWNELVYAAFLNGMGGALLYLAAAGKTWALVPLVPASLWMIYSYATSPLVLREMNPRLAGAWEWAYGLIGAAVWLYCAAVAFLSAKIAL